MIRLQKQSILFNLVMTLVLMAALFLPSIALAQDADTVCTDEDDTVIDCPTDDGSDAADTEDSAAKPIPPGQIVRRCLSGPIVGVGDGYILIETNFGVVKVLVNAEVDESIIGQRIAVKLSETEGGASNDDTTGDDTTGDDTETEFYREAVAEQFKLIPAKAAKQHKWGIIEQTSNGNFALVDDEGNSIPAECDGECDGQGVIGLVDDEDGDDDGDTPTLLCTESTLRIQERITACLQQAETDGDGEVMERLQAQLERCETKQMERQLRAEERAAVRAERANSQGVGNQGNNRGNGNGGGNSGNFNAGG